MLELCVLHIGLAIFLASHELEASHSGIWGSRTNGCKWLCARHVQGHLKLKSYNGCMVVDLSLIVTH